MTTERATREQIGRIVSMLVGGQIPFDLAQAIATNGVRIMTEQEKHTVYLEKSFPGYGEKLMKVLGLLYSWEPALRVPPKEIDLAYMEKSVFWREVTGIRPITRDEAVLLREDDVDDIWLSLRVVYEEQLQKLLGERWHELRESLRSIVFATEIGVKLNRSLDLSDRDYLWGLVWHSSLTMSLFYRCAFVLADKPEMSAKFGGLHELWLSGYYPIGFDKDGKLLVMVAG